jgi:hypothetical protein
VAGITGVVEACPIDGLDCRVSTNGRQTLS